MRRFGTLLSTASVLAFCMPTTQAMAQQDSVQDSNELNNIVVTARKRAESIQDAPVAITAFSSVELQEAAFDNILDVTKAAPGVFVESFNQTLPRYNTTPRFRGIFLSTGNPLQQTAGVFIDGIPIVGGIQGIGVSELERVEIIKGPQSALFGRNTFAGAINYVTKDPGEDFSADISLLAATRDEYRFAGSVEIPLSETIRTRLNASADLNGGHYNNSIVPDQKLGDQDTWSISGTILFEPSENFRAKIRGHYYEDNDGPAAVQHTAGNTFHNFGGFPIDPETGIANTSAPFDGVPNAGDVSGGLSTESVFAGTIRRPALDTIGLNTGSDTVSALQQAFMADGRSAAVIFPGGFDLRDFDSFGLRRNAYRISGDFEFDLSEDISFSILTGYNDEDVGFWNDFDQTEDASFTSFSTRTIQDFSIEARLSGTLLDGKLDWSAGTNYVDIEIESLGATANTFGSTFFFSGVFGPIDRTGAETKGIFGTLGYALTDQLTVNFEGRYQWDEIQEDNVNDGLPEPISPSTLKKFLPRVVVEFEPSDSTLLYANWSIGNLPGGFNPQVGELDAQQLAELISQAPGANITFGEEKLRNIEIGWKQSALDNRLAFNLAAFYMRRSDEIFRTIETVTDTDPGAPNPQRTVAFNANGATTDIFGFELDAAFNVNEYLSVQGSLGYVDATINSFPEGEGSGDFGDVFGPQADVSGQRAPRFPPWSASFSATWDQPVSIGNFDSWYTRADFFYTGDFWDENTNVTRIDSALDTNLRTGLKKGDMRVEFFVTNLFNETAPVAADNFADLSIANRLRPGGFFDFAREGTTIGLRPKRQFGARVTASF